MSRKRLFAPAVVAAVSVALVLSACGSNSGDGESSGAGASSGGDPIKIGNINAIGTKFNNDPARVAAVKAAVQAINADGGIKGRKLEVKFCNNNNEPNQGLECAQQLIDEGVIACVGCENDFNGGDVAKVFNQAGVPMVESEAIYPEEYNLPTSYLTSGGADYQVAGTPLLAHDLLDAKTFAYVGQDIPFSKAYHERIKIVAGQLGMQEVSTTYLPLDATNFDSYAAKLAAAKPDVILMITSPFQNIPLIKTIEGQGYRPTYILNGDVPRNDDFKKYGSAADRIYVVGDVPPLSSADQNAQIAEYVKQLEAYRTQSGDTEGTGLGDSRISSIRVWLAMQFIRQILEGQGGEISASSLVKGLDAAKDLESEMIPPWTPSSEGCFEEFSRVSNPSVRFLKIENGELVEADPDTHNVNDYLCK